MLSIKKLISKYTKNNLTILYNSGREQTKLDENLETLHLAPTLFYHLPVFFILKQEF